MLGKRNQAKRTMSLLNNSAFDGAWPTGLLNSKQDTRVAAAVDVRASADCPGHWRGSAFTFEKVDE